MQTSDSGVGLGTEVIELQEEAYGTADPTLLVNMAFQVFLIQRFEQVLLELADDGCIHGPVHTSIGEEACAIGAMAALDSCDKIVSTHRAHHHYLAKLIRYHIVEEGFDARAHEVSHSLQEGITTLMGEIMGLAIGCCGGRGGSMHLRNPKIGVLGSDAIVAGGVPLATGVAFAAKYRNSGEVTICFLGDEGSIRASSMKR